MDAPHRRTAPTGTVPADDVDGGCPTTRARSTPTSTTRTCPEDALVRLVREYALIVHILDRSMCAAIGMRHGMADMEALAIEEWRGRQPGLRRAAPADHGRRGRRRRGHLQGPPARPRLPPPLPRRPLRGGRREAWLLRAGLLRRADGRRAVGRQDGDQHVPPHRGRHLRRHRPGRQPQGPHPPRPPAARVPCDRVAALPLGGGHRRRQRDPARGRHHHDHQADHRGHVRVPADEGRDTPHMPTRRRCPGRRCHRRPTAAAHTDAASVRVEVRR